MSSPTPEDDRTVIQPFSGGAGRAAGSAQPAFPATAVASAAASKVATGSPNSAASSAGDSGNALAQGTYLGEFELTSVLGEGGFGIVYIAWDHSLQRRVALKEYMPASLAARTSHDGGQQVQVRSERHRDTFEAGLKSFINEARLLAQFDHPSLVKVYRFWEANGTAYMVMPLYDGITLKDKLKQMSSPPDEAWLLGLLAPLTDALAVIHAENCFHRDIAPDNVILLAGSERPLLLDFGAARRVIGDMTQALTVILKPGYAPVEQYAEVPEMKQGAWTDVYALAASVHFAIIGKTPPPSVGRLMTDNFVPLSQSAAGRYSDGFLQAIDKALVVRPADRTASIAALRADLGLPPPSALEATQFNPQPQATAMRRPAAGAAPAASPTPAPRPAAAGAATAAAPALAAGSGGNKGLLFGGGAALLVAAGAAAFFLLGKPGKPGIAPTVPPAGVAVAPAPSGTPAQTPAASPAVVPAAAPVPAPAARSFEIRDEFSKVIAGQAADFKVQAAAAQPQLRIGRDRLSFNVTSARDGFVQVLLLGPDGSLLLLFPNAQSSDSRIKAGQTLKLPQANWLLDTAEPAGAEDFLVIVSAQPRDYSDLSKERDYIFLKLPTGQRGADLAAGWTRSTPLLLGGIKSCPSADCEAYGAATFSVAIVH